MSKKVQRAAEDQNAADAVAALINPLRTKGELNQSPSGACTLPLFDSDAEDDQKQTTSFIKVESQRQPLTQI